MIALSYTLTSLLICILAVNAQIPKAPTPALLVPGKAAGKCLTAAGISNGSRVTIQPCAGTTQLWKFEGGSVKLADNLDKCLDVRDGVNADGTKLQIWDCFRGNTNQQFYYTGDNRLAWTDHGKCVDLTDGRVNDGNVIQVWTCGDGNTNQVWNTAYLL